ncbi:hypothetical protein F53441_8552 [Fusarium austroafricanum]|uniref:Ysc84 actin-binding domain-containing protein n=1 Tax=Fusarium austroafricanum TaxID=2364996 RepID=A0A8H4NX89_9HYPO|nr:hypothetical protein F53441_8552 [Fusarium austroafricanum]
MGLFKTADLRQESEKSARILKSFVDKNKIPSNVISNAKGLAIFTGFRAGMYFAGAGGSGVVISRLPDGSWSSPSAFSVRSGSVGLVYGIDVYDCICVLNTQEAVDAYKKSEVNLGSAVALAAGPLGGNVNMGDVKPVWTYTKSRGVYGGLTVDGTSIKEKKDVNAEFYGAEVTSTQILEGKVNGGWSSNIQGLLEVVKSAEGKSADNKILQGISAEPIPGDLTEFADLNRFDHYFQCDEVRPSCGGCSKHQVDCTYNRISGVASTSLSAPRTPGSQLLSTPSPSYRSISPGQASPSQAPTDNPQRRLLELRLLHVYMSEICPQIPGTHVPALQTLWSKEVPKIALQNETLLNAIFAISCFYLLTEGKDPDTELQIARAGYLGAAIEAHQQNLSNLTKDNADVACFVSILLTIDTFANLMVRPLEPYEPPFHWLQMTRGLGGVFREAISLLRNEPDAKMRLLVADRSYVNPDIVFSKSNLKGLENLVTFRDEEVSLETDVEAYEKAACFIGSVMQAKKDGDDPKMIGRRLNSFWVMCPARAWKVMGRLLRLSLTAFQVYNYPDF